MAVPHHRARRLPALRPEERSKAVSDLRVSTLNPAGAWGTVNRGPPTALLTSMSSPLSRACSSVRPTAEAGGSVNTVRVTKL